MFGLRLGLGLDTPPVWDSDQGSSNVTIAAFSTAGSGAVSPNDASEVLHLAADLNVTSDINGVSAWGDLSSSATNFTQATNANKPSLIPAGTYPLPTLRAPDKLRGLASSSTALASPATWIFVFSNDESTAQYAMTGTTDSLSCIIAGFTGSSFEWFSGLDRQTFVSTPTTGLHTFMVTQIDGVSCIGYYDGVQVFTFTPTATVHPMRTILGDTALVNGLKGNAAEAICCNTALGSTVLNKYQAYLKAKWGTP